MDALWLLEGPRTAPGWGPLEADSRGNQVDLLLFDREGWALLRAPEAPTKYDGLVPTSPPRDGLYLDSQGHAIYIAAGKVVKGPREVLATLGAQAEELLRKVGDPDAVLERLGRVY